jgi:hypothetical protein
MINNTTTSILNQSAESVNDSIYAVIFITFVLLWYSSSIVFLLAMQIGTSNEIREDCSKHPSKLFVQRLRDRSDNKEILSKKNQY